MDKHFFYWRMNKAYEKLILSPTPWAVLCPCVFFLASFTAQSWAQIDTDASTRTKTLYDNLRIIQNSPQFLFGQEFFNSFKFSSGSAQGDPTFSDCNEVTGTHPAVLGSDFHYYLEKSVAERNIHTEAVKWAYRQGYAITFDWHLSGKGTNTYQYQESTKDLVDSIVAYPNGKERAWLYAELDKVISIINNDLVVNNERIPIVFRPWHEMNGNWFWWGAVSTNSTNYKVFYALTVAYIKSRTTSVLFCWSPNTPANFDYYPGDDYVDILGLDYYEINSAELRLQLARIVDHAQANNKVAVFSESGNRTSIGDQAAGYWKNTVLPALLEDPTGKSIKIAWLLTWINASWSFPYVPHSASSAMAKQSFIDFKNSPHTIFGSQTQNLYEPWIVTAFQDNIKEPLPSLVLYPIPATDVLSIRLIDFDLPARIRITDLAGKIIYTSIVQQNETTHSISSIAVAGFYLVYANNQSSEFSAKLIVR
ncbi:MAG: T9SS type A sorting domain-containing protein [Bacteroidia bacterium]|nr:T9SS type A sorting domain-containing protein [Bacteroidia bacterium]